MFARLATLVAFVLAFNALWAAPLHRALIPHGVCEHGQLVDGAPTGAPSHSDRGAPEQRDDQRTEDHNHCTAGADVVSTDGAVGWQHGTVVARALPHAAPAPTDDVPAPLPLSCAPKTGPPVA